MTPPPVPAPARAAKLLRGFDRNSRARRRALAARFGGAAADRLTASARQEYERLLPEVDAIGGGLMNSALASTYEYLAYFKAMRAEGHSLEEIGTFYDESFTALIERFPGSLLGLVFRLARPFLRFRLRREAAASQSSTDPGAWRFEFVEKRRGGHDFGFDVTNCAVCAAFARHDASDIVPYLCALDDRMSAALGMGLRRSGTRALGSGCCDFRYRAGGEAQTLRSRYSLPVLPAAAGDPDR